MRTKAARLTVALTAILLFPSVSFAQIGLQQVSEVLAVPNVDYVGKIPDDVQYMTIYAAAAVSNSSQIDAAQRLIAFLSSEAATAAIRKSGMEPLAKK